MAQKALKSWKDLELGTAITDPGCAQELKTGDWRSMRPVLDKEKCIKCGLCAVYCPEFCVHENEEGFFEAALYYCKGCGICSHECPKDAIEMVTEEK